MTSKDYESFELFGDRGRIYQGNASFGYTPQTALADILDNSIAANASTIRVQNVKQPGGAIEVRISDDGDGMSLDRLKEAMAFGSPKASNELSKFGFGMKTASLEMSKGGFRVYTRDVNGEESMAALLAEDQEGTGSPIARLYRASQIPKGWRAYLDTTTTNGSGTVIVWSDANLKEADHFKKDVGTVDDMLRRVGNKIKPHLGLVFHRWISGDNAEGRKVKIIYDKETVEAWNPFDEEWLDTENTSDAESFTVQFDDGMHEIKISPYLVKLDTRGDKDHPARKIASYSGLYVYRADRVICGPDWMGLGITSGRTDTSPVRFKIDIPIELDEYLKLDVKKSNITLPEELFQHLEPYVGRYQKIATDWSSRNTKKNNKKQTPAQALAQVERSLKRADKQAPFVSPERVGPNLVITTSEDGMKFNLRSRLNTGGGEAVIEWVDAHEIQGYLWEPTVTGNGKLILRVNQEHDFYQKVLLPAPPEAQAGMLQLLIAFSRAEYRTHHSDFELQWEHARQHISTVLNYMCEELELPDRTLEH
jgi:hypothetical protein